MNAYELADELEGWSDDWLSSGNKKNVFKKHAKMLRQQADRIAHLEMLLANRNEIIDKLDLTSPQIKELSDEEIQEVAQALIDDCSYCALHFARAILKKASEK